MMSRKDRSCLNQMMDPVMRGPCVHHLTIHYIAWTMLLKYRRLFLNQNGRDGISMSLNFLSTDFQKSTKYVYRLRTDPQVSGKRSTALALPINGSRLRKATDQELASLFEKLEKRALLDSVDSVTATGAADMASDMASDMAPVSFVLPISCLSC